MPLVAGASLGRARKGDPFASGVLGLDRRPRRGHHLAAWPAASDAIPETTLSSKGATVLQLSF